MLYLLYNSALSRWVLATVLGQCNRWGVTGAFPMMLWDQEIEAKDNDGKEGEWKLYQDELPAKGTKR